MLAFPAMAASPRPEKLIRETSDKVLDELKTNAEIYKKDPQQGIYDLVNDRGVTSFRFYSDDRPGTRAPYKDDVNVPNKSR